jgi:hypothetical protein
MYRSVLTKHELKINIVYEEQQNQTANHSTHGS